MATEPDIQRVVDRGEDIAAMQPMKIGEGGSRFRDAVDLALELAAKSAAFRSSLPRSARPAAQPNRVLGGRENGSGKASGQSRRGDRRHAVPR